MSDAEKKGLKLPEFFTIVYLSDVFTSLLAAMMWGDFPATNIIMVEMVNSVIAWVVFKLMVYLVIILVFKYFSRYSTYAENILMSVTVVYSIMMLNNLSSLTLTMPNSNLSQEFLQAIEQNRVNIIP
jgi:hypothetical protein